MEYIWFIRDLDYALGYMLHTWVLEPLGRTLRARVQARIEWELLEFKQGIVKSVWAKYSVFEALDPLGLDFARGRPEVREEREFTSIMHGNLLQRVQVSIWHMHVPQSRDIGAPLRPLKKNTLVHRSFGLVILYSRHRGVAGV